MSEKIYCGSARVINTQYGELTKVSFHKDDINKIVKWMKADGGDWANLVIKEKREKVEGKPTHYLEIDEWKPTPQNEPTQNIPPEPATLTPEQDDLPF